MLAKGVLGSNWLLLFCYAARCCSRAYVLNVYLKVRYEAQFRGVHRVSVGRNDAAGYFLQFRSP